jgi:rod shape-determining protein MreD
VRVLRFSLALAAALLVHFVGVRLWPEFPRAVDLFLVVLVYEALDGNALGGLLAGVAVGLLEDSLTGGLFGFFGCADTLVGYGTARLAQRVVIQRAPGVMLVFLAAAVVQQLVLAILALLLFPDPQTPDPLWVGVRAASSAVLGLLLVLAGRQGRARYDRWRRGRVGRLHWR